MNSLLMLFFATALAQSSFKFTAPQGWTARQAASSMRVAEFTLPKAAADPENAEVAVFYFGGQGGSVQANLDRWMNQMQQPDGRPSRDVARTSSMTANGLKITVVDVTGRYVAEIAPGSAERHSKAGFRLIAAVVETPRGPYFVKVTGPQKTVEQWHSSVMDFLKSVRVE